MLANLWYSVRTREWRLTEWLRWAGECPHAPSAAAPALVELYNHTGDTAPLDLDAAEYDN